MLNEETLSWLLEGDVSLKYLVNRDLLDNKRKDLQKRVALEGWGKKFLSKRHPNGHWGASFYQPKWTSTHYTLLDLRNLNIAHDNAEIRSSILQVLDSGKSADGGIPLGPSTQVHSDVCVNAMFLNYASYFKTEETRLHSIVDCILNEIMPDGGFNCRTTRSGATHSSLHTTISVLEGFHEFLKSGTDYRRDEILKIKKSAEEFILIHQLFLSDHTGEIINKEFLKMTYPCRWKYDIFRALDYFQSAKHPWDKRMEGAVNVLMKKRNRSGTWNMQAAHPGQVHLVMERAGQTSRWNTLRALRILQHFKKQLEVES